MPWFEYVCEKCGEKVARQRPVAHRDVPPRHNEQDRCWDGLLRRVAPVSGPGARRPPDRARPAEPTPPDAAEPSTAGDP